MIRRPPRSTLSLHDALPISKTYCDAARNSSPDGSSLRRTSESTKNRGRSEEHTSELQSPAHLVCRLLLDKNNTEGSLLVPDSLLDTGIYSLRAATSVVAMAT